MSQPQAPSPAETLPAQPWRLPPPAGGTLPDALIDRSHGLTFRFDGRGYTGHPGDTLASALLANGIHRVARSFKYHRPRGILTDGPAEPNALVHLRSGAHQEPNTKATLVELFEGLEARSQNAWPSLGFDVMAVNGLFGPIFAAGFYYKTFMWPKAFWERLYEPLIRRAAGMGALSGLADPDHYEVATLHGDVLIVGGGAAGLIHALIAGRAGLRVILCEGDARFGGRLLSEAETLDGAPARAWVEATLKELRHLPSVTLMPRTTVVSRADSTSFAALERITDHLPQSPAHTPRQVLWHLRVKHAVLATGAQERPLVFPHNDRPGIMLASAVRGYIHRYGVKPGRRALVVSATADGWRTLDALRHAGIAVAGIVSPREPSPELRELAAETRILAPAQILATRGRHRVEAVQVCEEGGAPEWIACDLVAMSGGWDPALHLASHHGQRPVWREELLSFTPGVLPSDLSAIGSADGTHDLGRLLQGAITHAAELAQALGASTGALPPAPRPGNAPDWSGVTPCWRMGDKPAKSFVDPQHDVTVADIQLAHREGFDRVELLKRYTTLGMATDQGRIGNVNGLALLAEAMDQPIANTGATMFRPPVTPVAIGAYAGAHRGTHYKPVRLPPTHSWARDQGAVFVEAGPWLRAQWYPQPGEGDWLESVNREVQAVRSGVGLCDVSTLGKIELTGADAGTLLDRIYTGRFSTLKPGRVRYGLMLREDGFVFDDGTTACLAPGHYVMTTTTAQAVAVMAHLEFCCQALWPSLDVQLASTTDQWAQVAVAGPKSLALLQAVAEDPGALSDEVLPFMGACQLRLADGPRARLFRISFSGERAYELAVPARHGRWLMERLMKAGEPLGVTPYGTEALSVLRIEKGHVAGGELNGQTTAHDLGLGRMVGGKKDFIGRTLALRPALTDPARPRLVGLRPLDPRHRPTAGAHVIAMGAPTTAEHDQGWLTSVAHSATLNSWIALAMVKRGPERLGETVRAVDLLRQTEVTMQITPPHFYDPKGERLYAIA